MLHKEKPIKINIQIHLKDHVKVIAQIEETGQAEPRHTALYRWPASEVL